MCVMAFCYMGYEGEKGVFEKSFWVSYGQRALFSVGALAMWTVGYSPFSVFLLFFSNNLVLVFPFLI